MAIITFDLDQSVELWRHQVDNIFSYVVAAMIPEIFDTRSNVTIIIINSKLFPPTRDIIIPISVNLVLM